MTSFPSIKTILTIEKKPSQCLKKINSMEMERRGKKLRGGMSLQSVLALDEMT